MSCQQAIAQNEFHKILWFRADPNSLGTAYDTRCPAHLLNVPAKLMGLDPSAPSGFHDWLARNRPGRWQPEEFVPRMEFGAYMQSGIDALDARVQQIHLRAARAEKTQQGWRISTIGESFDADALIVAPGFPLAQLSRASANVPGVFEAWQWFNEVANTAIVQRLADKVLLVGSGLTAVDMVLGLRALGYAGEIEVVSSSGHWPLPHAISEPLCALQLAPILAELNACTSPAAVVATLRRAAKTQPWRTLLDALRPHTNTVWTSWPASLRLKLVKRAYSFWGRHRHRVPPQTLAAVLADPLVSLRKGRVKTQNGLLTINGVLQPAGQLTLFCVGARFSDGISPDPLLAPLMQQGLLKANALNIGLLAADNISLALIGARRFGELFETVAVPELRQQAELAIRMLSNRVQAEKLAR